LRAGFEWPFETTFIEMNMIIYMIETRGDGLLVPRERSSPQARQVRLGLLSWPPVALAGTTVAAAIVLFGHGDGCNQTPASRTLIGNESTVKAIAFRPDGAMLSSVGVDGALAIFELTARPENASLPRGLGPVCCAAFGADNRVLATATSATKVTLHDLVDHGSRMLDDTTASTTGATCLAFSPNGPTLAVGQQDGRITLWDAGTGRHRSTLSGHTGFVVSLAFAPDGATLASSGGDLMTRIWDLATDREVFAISSPMTAYVALAFSQDSRLLCLGAPTSPVVRLWDVTAWVERATLEGATGSVLALAISPDGTTLAAADLQEAVTFWDLATLKIRPRRLRHAGVRSLAFAPDGRALATGGFDGAIQLWAFPIASDD
jgi:WD40 repeat protein